MLFSFKPVKYELIVDIYYVGAEILDATRVDILFYVRNNACGFLENKRICDDRNQQKCPLAACSGKPSRT